MSKVIIAGSRSIKTIYLLNRAIDECGFSITEVVSGGADGVDTLGEQWAKRNHIEVRQFLPDYDQYGSRAPLIRNSQMADYADAAVVITNGSPGSAHMISQMKKRNKPVRVLRRVKEDRSEEK